MLMRPHPQFLTRHDAPGRRELAYLAQQGAGPAVIWLGGFRSDMRATKAEALANWAAQEGRVDLLKYLVEACQVVPRELEQLRGGGGGYGFGGPRGGGGGGGRGRW